MNKETFQGEQGASSRPKSIRDQIRRLSDEMKTTSDPNRKIKLKEMIHDLEDDEAGL